MEKIITIPTAIHIPSDVKTLTIKLKMVTTKLTENKKKWGNLDEVKGILAKRKSDDPLIYQRKIRKEWR